MAEKQVWKHEVTYHPESIEDKSTAHNNDIRVKLPETIKKLNLWKGDKIQIERVEVEDLFFLICKSTERPLSEDDMYKIYNVENKPPRMTLKSGWVDEFLDYEGDESLVVEVNEIEEQFRVYKNEDYNEYRIDELKDQGITPITGKPVVLILASLAGAQEAVIPSQDNSVTNDQQDKGYDEELRRGFGNDINDEYPS